MATFSTPDILVPEAAPVHGGDLAAARRQFPGAPEPFIDLSTGINPHGFPIPPLAAEVFARLPEPDTVARLCAQAGAHYGAPSGDHVVATPGTQALLPWLARLVAPGRAAILAPTYAEHARAAAAAGHRVREAAQLEDLATADLAVVVNPNNPDGRLIAPDRLIALADALTARGKILVVDEAFMDVGPAGASCVAAVRPGRRLVVLRSFGKFFGLAGIRLGFAVTEPDLAARLRSALGPWAVSGPALAIASAALADRTWIQATRERLRGEGARLDGLLRQGGLEVVGGTDLFRLIRSPDAAGLFQRLGEAGLLVRRFAERPSLLRFGLPGTEAAWERLERIVRGETHPIP